MVRLAVSIFVVLALMLSSVAFARAAVDCKMARDIAAGFTRAQLNTMGTVEQRKQ